MTQIKSVLCPIDLSDNSLATIDLATVLAKQYGAKLIFIHVAPQWLPEDAMFANQYIRETVDEDKTAFLKIRPADESVGFEHLFVNGNPGPEIVRATLKHDLVVMNSHGRSGLMRLLMGSVAQYVMRHAHCPVISFKTTGSKRIVPSEKTESTEKHFVTERMHHVSPIQGFAKMENVIAELALAKETGAPVINEMGCCVGILTESDIKKYRDVQQRFANRDESVVDDVFEVDEFGQRRAGSFDFDQVHRHMTSPVVTVSNLDLSKKAVELFATNRKIHHLVVVDERNCPVGILTSRDLADAAELSSET